MDRIQSLGNVIDSPERQETLNLAADDTAPGMARSFTRDVLTAWGLAELLDRAVLIVSELTTNAELYGRSREGAGDEQITLTLAVRAGVVGIAVDDQSPLLPAPRIASPCETSGRGLFLVTATADAWTSCPRSDGSGKRVLAFVSRTEPALEGSLP